MYLSDFIKETAPAPGLSAYALAGAVAGFAAIPAAANGLTLPYGATDGTNWETGIGTYTHAGRSLARTTIKKSSNADAAVNWAGGTITVVLCLLSDMVPATYGTSTEVLYGNASGAPTWGAVVAPAGTLTGTVLNATVVTSSLTSVGTLTGLAVASGSIAASAPFTFTQTWNNAAVTFTGLDINITNTASVAGSYLQAWRLGGAMVARVDILGNLHLFDAAGTTPTVSMGRSAVTSGNDLAISIQAGGSYAWGASTNPYYADTNLNRVAAGWAAVGTGGQPSFAGSMKLTNLQAVGYAELDEMTAPAGAANSARLFTQDSGAGKTQLMVIFGSGTAIQLAIEA